LANKILFLKKVRQQLLEGQKNMFASEGDFPNFKIEIPKRGGKSSFSEAPKLERAETYEAYYCDNFKGKSHIIFAGNDETHGPVVIVSSTDTEQPTVPAIIFTGKVTSSLLSFFVLLFN
jgi:hypothetical protein